MYRRITKQHVINLQKRQLSKIDKSLLDSYLKWQVAHAQLTINQWKVFLRMFQRNEKEKNKNE